MNIPTRTLQVRTDMVSTGNRFGTLEADPWLVGVGPGWRS